MEMEPLSAVSPVAATSTQRSAPSTSTVARQALAGLANGDWPELLDRLNVPLAARKPLMSALRDWFGGSPLPAAQSVLIAQVPQQLSPDKRGELLARLYTQALTADRPNKAVRLAPVGGAVDLSQAQRAVELAAVPPMRHPRALLDVAQWLGSNDPQAAEWLLDAARERIVADGARRAARAFTALEKLALSPPAEPLKLRFELPAGMVNINYSPPRSLFGWLTLLVVALIVLSLWL